MTLELIHDGGGIVKMTDAISGRVWFDTYFHGASIHHTSVKTEEVDDIIMDLMDKGYYVK